jgi:chemotaxis response regulator CheB
LNSPLRRARIGVLAASQSEDDVASLGEWLLAGGFQPEVCTHEAREYEVLLVRWPAVVDLTSIKVPIVLMAANANEVPARIAASVAGVLELPDVCDMKSLLAWSSQLLAVLRQLTTTPATAPANQCALPAVTLEPRELQRPAPAVVAIGISTGGPMALPVLLQSLRGRTMPPLVVVQHIPGSFLATLVERLRRECGANAVIAADRQLLEPDRVYFAPAERHLRLVADAGALRAKLVDDPPRRGHRPAVEVLLESCAGLPVRGVGVMMTGMGQDGAQGLLRLRQLGWATLGQNAATCAIYGMPKAASQLGALEREVALEEIGPWLLRLCRSPQPQRAT